MDYPNFISNPRTDLNTVSIDARVQDVVNCILTKSIIPYGDYGQETLYYFDVMPNGLGNIIYTTFDRNTTLGLSSFMVRYGAATTIRQVISLPLPGNSVELKHMVLPKIPIESSKNGLVLP